MSGGPARPRSERVICVLAGGVGAARMLTGLCQVVPPALMTAIVNVGDDLELHGLHISPDIDTIVYTLAGAANPGTGWGLADETWNAMDSLARYTGEGWFRLGDRDLGTHMFRTGRLAEGADLATVTAEIAAAWGLEVNLVPVTNDPLRTKVTIDDGTEVDFQDYFVRLRHSVAVRSVRFDGDDSAQPAPGVIEALQLARTIVIAPSNPIVSIGPLLAVRGIREVLETRRDRVIAVSPIVAGAALKGPADRMLRELGHQSTVAGVARLYRDIASVLVIDDADAALGPAVESEGIGCLVTPTVMSDPVAAGSLARVVLGATG